MQNILSNDDGKEFQSLLLFVTLALSGVFIVQDWIRSLKGLFAIPETLTRELFPITRVTNPRVLPESVATVCNERVETNALFTPFREAHHTSTLCPALK